MHKPTKYTLNEKGIIISPNFHDGYIVGIELKKDKTVHLKLQTLDDKQFILEMQGVERLLCNEFAEGNIIFDIVIINNREPNEKSLRYLLGEPHPKAQELYIRQHQEMIAREKANILKGEKVFVNITTSYGCELHCICRSLNLLETDSNILL